jgi:hypothetical protein
MSRWLSSVNNLLEKLDDRVETVVEERVALAQDNNLIDDLEDEAESGKSAAALDRILAKRGLSLVHSQDEEDTNGGGDECDGDVELGRNHSPENLNPTLRDESAKGLPIITGEKVSQSSQIATERLKPGQSHQSGDLDESKRSESTSSVEHGIKVIGTEAEVQITPNCNSEPASQATDSMQGIPGKAPPSTPPKKTPESDSTLNLPPTKISSSSTGSRPTGGTPNRTQKERELILEMKEAQKECRTLRRHVVSLNEQLEAAEYELQAQRKELERAAERMEKERIRAKEEKEAFQKRQSQEIMVLKQQNEKTLKESQARFEELLEGYRTRLKEEENKRKQEGGDWNKEITQAIDREQEMRQVVIALEDEKAVLLSRVSTLEGQQTALGSRLESLTQAADKAMEREREAEDRLDSLLSQHARQISQRQVSWMMTVVLGLDKPQTISLKFCHRQERLN